MKQKLFSILALLLMAVTGNAAEKSETISLIGEENSENETATGTHFKVTCGYLVIDDGGLTINKFGAMTVSALDGTVMTKVTWSYQALSQNAGTLSATPGTYNGSNTVTGINSTTLTVTSSHAAGVKLSSITIYYEVEDVAVTGITLDKTSAEMTVGGETLTLTPTVAPNDATDKTVTWTTSAPAVATVANGVVTAMAAGTATITATATNGTDDTSDDKTATCTVTVAPAATGYSVTLKDGTEDDGNWKAKVGNGELQALPLTGLTGDGTETVTITYNGSKRVKSVTADPSVIGVTTFSELKTALSAGKNVKLKNDIVCTAEISITGNVALTIDGNGKKLSATSAIRAFTVGYYATVAFKNLTLTEFVSGGGPAINNFGTIVLDGCTISNCHVNNSNGGGAIESSGKLYAINTTFSGNYSGEIGGAINNYGGSLYMSECTFTNNYTTDSDAKYGGAIGINGGSEVRLINCTFSGNKYGTTTGPSDIGVFYKPTNSDYTIAGCTGVTIAPNEAITTNATGTATLDYSDLSDIKFTYTAQ